MLLPAGSAAAQPLTERVRSEFAEKPAAPVFGVSLAVLEMRPKWGAAPVVPGTPLDPEMTRKGEEYRAQNTGSQKDQWRRALERHDMAIGPITVATVDGGGNINVVDRPNPPTRGRFRLVAQVTNTRVERRIENGTPTWTFRHEIVGELFDGARRIWRCDYEWNASVVEPPSTGGDDPFAASAHATGMMIVNLMVARLAADGFIRPDKRPQDPPPAPATIPPPLPISLAAGPETRSRVRGPLKAGVSTIDISIFETPVPWVTPLAPSGEEEDYDTFLATEKVRVAIFKAQAQSWTKGLVVRGTLPRVGYPSLNENRYISSGLTTPFAQHSVFVNISRCESRRAAAGSIAFTCSIYVYFSESFARLWEATFTDAMTLEALADGAEGDAQIVAATTAWSDRIVARALARLQADGFVPAAGKAP